MLCYFPFAWYFLFFFFVVNIVVVVRFLVTIADDGQILSTCCVSVSVVEKRKGLFEHLKRKKTTSSALTFVSQKTPSTRHSRTEKKMRFIHAPSISCCCFPLSFFHSVFFSRLVLSFSCASHLLLYYYDYPTHVMMLTRIRNPYCCVCFL